ncbi:prolyl aminopeptidase [Maricaulis parjimensis]|uniref:prolyl aminopeptidase n=1 Tax=Maricaulis parjimensis TaxID=144023 RepID=UPI00193AD57B|nr:prolyl aminopeptidase [Maricaulis parjimensis]
MSHYFDAIEPRSTGRLAVTDGHDLAYDLCANPDGLPLLFLHGGPGSGAAPKYRRMFDPDVFNLVLFDQRSCGRSTPHLDLTANTTQHLIADIEALRDHLGIERWIVFGPSWGSTLALAYAQTHPERVLGLVVEGIFLGRPQDMDWLQGPNGARMAFPDAFAHFIAPVPETARSSVRATMEWYFEAMKAEVANGLEDLEAALKDPATALDDLRQSALYRWTEYEDRLSYLDNPAEAVRDGLKTRGEKFIAAHSLIEAHYFLNDCFLEPDQLLRDASRLADIPMHILQSRYDMVCPASAAFELAEACPHAGFDLVPVNGHGMTETTQAVLNRIMTDLVKAISPPGR